jgi:hypothetical protein
MTAFLNSGVYFINLRCMLLKPTGVLSKGKLKRKKIKMLEVEIPVVDKIRAEQMLDYLAHRLADAFQEAESEKAEIKVTGEDGPRAVTAEGEVVGGEAVVSGGDQRSGADGGSMEAGPQEQGDQSEPPHDIQDIQSGKVDDDDGT